MTSDEGDGAGVRPVCQRNLGVSARGKSGGDAGDNFVGNARFAQRFCFLGSSAEDQGVAPLEVNDGFALPRLVDQALVDVGPALGMLAGQISHAQGLGIGSGQFERAWRGEIVVKNEVRLAQAFHGAKSTTPDPPARRQQDKRALVVNRSPYFQIITTECTENTEMKNRKQDG